MAAATHEELERLTEKWAGSRLSREDHARMSELRDDDYQRIVVEGGIRRVRRERARHGLDESEARPARAASRRRSAS
jgi:hypothetical protein